jgi:AcrR family transcriptional regulator
VTTRERRQREFEAREERFLQAAEDIIAAEGFLNLQMARLAQACDYATGTLYQHFSSKEDLLLALVVRQQEAHIDVFRQVERWRGTNARERMFAIVVGDLDFTRRHPDHMKLAHYVHTQAVWENASEARRTQALACSGPIGEVVTGIVREALAAGALDETGLSPMALALGPWSISEGMNSLNQIKGLFEALQIEDTDRLLLRQVQTYMNGLGWRPFSDPADEAVTARLVARIRAEVFASAHDAATGEQA